jgi:hypothetical protein
LKGGQYGNSILSCKQLDNSHTWFLNKVKGKEDRAAIAVELAKEKKDDPSVWIVNTHLSYDGDCIPQMKQLLKHLSEISSNDGRFF